MHNSELHKWIPERDKNFADNEREVGVELEFAGCEPAQILQSITDCFGGAVITDSIFHYQVRDTTVGNFTLELDAAMLQKLAPSVRQSTSDDIDFSLAETLLKSAAEQVVPWEVVTPPIKVSQLSTLQSLFSCFRQHGAVGTRHAVHYAFGLHLNPDLPDLSANTLVSYMQAYLCLYDWIYEQENIDIVRKITPYIDHFNKEYILKVVDTNYRPDMDTFIQDYLQHNPSRNRSLDLLPLIGYIDEKWIADHKEKALIKPRPTFHYRLPNCDIDNADWNLHKPWRLWLKVEQLANNRKALDTFIIKFREHYQRLTHAIDNKWIKQCDVLLKKTEKEDNSL